VIRTSIALFAITFLVSCLPNKQNFKIDKSISPTIDSIFKANVLFDDSVKRGVLFQVRNTFDYGMLGQSDMDWSYFLRANSDKPAKAFMEMGSECYLNNDTITLTAVLAQEVSLGIQLLVFDNKFNSQARLIATKKIYSKTEREDDLQNDIVLNPETSALILVERPKLKSGGRLKGRMELKFEPLYQLDSFGTRLKIVPQFDIIFDTEIR
jgi:hypothetical protein